MGSGGCSNPWAFPSPPLLRPLFYISAKRSPLARCKSLLRCRRCAGPCPPSPPPSRGPAQTSPRHGQDLSPLDHPEHYWGLKVASARRARPPPPSRPPAVGAGAGGRVPLPGRGGVGRGCPQPATAAFPMAPRVISGLPGGWRGRGSQSPAPAANSPRKQGASSLCHDIVGVIPKAPLKGVAGLFPRLRFPCTSLSVFNNSLPRCREPWRFHALAR